MIQTRSATARRGAARSGPGGATGPADATDGMGASRRPDRAEAGSWPVRERSLLGPVLGIPPLAAVGLAVGLTAVGVLVDLLRLGTVGTVFQIGYGAGCLAAVAWVRRRSIFLPAIQPPLLLAVVVPALAVLIGAPSSTAGITEHVLLAGAPLINAFPAMALTTVLVLLVAGFRLLRQRTGPDDAVGSLRRRLSGRATDPSESPAAPDRGRAPGDRSARGRPAPGRTGRGRPATATDRDSGGRGTPGDRAGGTQRSSGGRSPSARIPGGGSRRKPTATQRGSAPSSKSASSNPAPDAPGSGRPTEARARKRPPDARPAEDGTGRSKRSAPDPSDAPARRSGRSASGRERSTRTERGSRSGHVDDGTRTGRSRRDTP